MVDHMIKVWDASTRLFHWALVASVFICWLSMEYRWLDVHKWSGIFVLFLLIFRVIWGFLGSKTARFSDFFVWPWQAFFYLRESLANKNNTYHAGHNPAGGWMVIILILLLSGQVITGLLANDDVGFNGPFADSVTKDISDIATKIHAVLFKSLLIMVWLHIVAVYFYVLVKWQNLFMAMITGNKPLAQVGNFDNLFIATSKRALAVMLISLIVTIYLIL